MTIEPDLEIAEVVERADVIAAGHLFDGEPDPAWTDRFLSTPGHHLLVAAIAGSPAGFVTGIEIGHPDKNVEMLLYELGVDETFRRRGVGRALVEALCRLATARGCRGMWVPVEADDDAAIATYRSAGAGPIEAAAIMSWEIGEPRPI